MGVRAMRRGAGRGCNGAAHERAEEEKMVEQGESVEAPVCAFVPLDHFPLLTRLAIFKFWHGTRHEA
jgi:hypothetical protein